MHTNFVNFYSLVFGNYLYYHFMYSESGVVKDFTTSALILFLNVYQELSRNPKEHSHSHSHFKLHKLVYVYGDEWLYVTCDPWYQALSRTTHHASIQHHKNINLFVICSNETKIYCCSHDQPEKILLSCYTDHRYSHVVNDVRNHPIITLQESSIEQISWDWSDKK